MLLHRIELWFCHSPISELILLPSAEALSINALSIGHLKVLDLNITYSSVELEFARIKKNWMNIGICMRLSCTQLPILDDQHQQKSRIARIFSYWEKYLGDKPKTWSTMIEELKTCKLTLACDLESSTPNSSTTSLHESQCHAHSSLH